MDVALFEPQIPQNTGSIARSCAATCSPLHIIGATPFEISEKTVRRAGLDYWPFVTLHQHKSWDDFKLKVAGRKIWIIETSGITRYSDVMFDRDDILLFGGEVHGVPLSVQEDVGLSSVIKIPMFADGVRSLNLSNAVSLVLYEALRQTGFVGAVR